MDDRQKKAREKLKEQFLVRIRHCHGRGYYAHRDGLIRDAEKVLNVTIEYIDGDFVAIDNDE